VTDAPDQDLLHRVIEHPALPARWREYFRKRSLSKPSTDQQVSRA
jgi:hypothetical protein